MEMEQINSYMSGLVGNREMAAGALLVRKHGKTVYQEKWGECEFDSVYRMMSMTKPITATGILKLMEQGKLSIEDPVSKYLPAFHNIRVAADDRYVYDPARVKKLMMKLPLFRLDRVKTVPAERDITLRDLLTHSSGLEQGVVGLMAMLKMRPTDKTLQERVDRYAAYPLDFQPGCGTGYSPGAGFDLLGRIIEIVSGMRLDEFVRREIAAPLDMKDTTFFLSGVQRKRLVPVYVREKDDLINVTGTDKDMFGMLKQKEIQFEQGCGGLFSTLVDYDHFASMLAAGGKYDGTQFLKPETVELMRTEGTVNHLEPEPGMVWGLGVKIRQDPAKAGSSATAGTYGWSGAFGTHFFISPKDDLEAVFVTNRADLGGSGSYISAELEKLVFAIFAER